MKFFKPQFRDYVSQNASQQTISRYADSVVKELTVSDTKVKALVYGTFPYTVEVSYNAKKVISGKCSCPYDFGGICKHIVLVLIKADNQLHNEFILTNSDDDLVELEAFVFPNKQLTDLSNMDVMKNATSSGYDATANRRIACTVETCVLNRVDFSVGQNYHDYYDVIIEQSPDGVKLSCTCGPQRKTLCEHQVAALMKTLESDDLILFFSPRRRHAAFLSKAKELGVEGEANLDNYFELEQTRYDIRVKSKTNALIWDEGTRKELEKNLAPLPFSPEQLSASENQDNSFVVVKLTDYTNHLQFNYMGAGRTKEGKLKSPLRPKIALNELFTHTNASEINFFAALSKYENNFRSSGNIQELSVAEFAQETLAIKHIIANPLKLEFYLHDGKKSDNLTSNSIEPIELLNEPIDIELEVEEKGVFYEITCKVALLNKRITSDRVKLFGEFFILFGPQLILVENLTYLRTLNYFRKQKHRLLIHKNKFEDFRVDFLSPLESHVKINYSFVKPAPLQLVEKEGLDTINQRIIYLADSENYVLITPTIRYGKVEIPIRSKRELYTYDANGNPCIVERNTEEEYRFIREIEGAHPDFENQEQTDYYYLHKRYFLDEDWFLDVFEQWSEAGYEILGFNALKNNRLNQNKMKVQTTVNREMDWFDVNAVVSFGNQTIGLRDIQKSVANRSKFVKLGDGTMGLLPEEWIHRFSRYFRSGEINGDQIRVHKTNFELIEILFEQAELPEEIQVEIEEYRTKLQQFNQIETVQVPKLLNATLRDYQKEGLNWLNFLDEFGFGGCLADDMGLGKTIQLIAYLLVQKEKGRTEANLVVVPTSLLFNWQAEVEKFAPSLKVKVIYGVNRSKKNSDFDEYDIILTSYGTLISDIVELKNYYFNCIILDESQAIKNPDSKRYKSVRLLQSRQKIVLTGTPMENNTFDLFSQLSFAIPGLFGSAKRFADDYATPIDRFQDSARAKELQKKIHPFILRRTKKQVAQELPEKTEMIVYCEMPVEQRKVYDAYKKEFQSFLKSKNDNELRQSSMHVLQGLTKLRQICNSPALLSDDEFYGDESAKLTELMEQIVSKSKEHKILVFSQFVGMLDLIRAELDKTDISYNYLTGQTKKRQEQVEQFQGDDESRVFLISLKAGGTGLNLTEADYVFIVDPWWNPAVENQAIDRCYRIGQQKKVVAIRLICPDTIEEKIMLLQASKRELAEELITTDAHFTKKLSKADLLGLL